MNICEKAALASIKFEMTNTELKRRYLINNIEKVHSIMEITPGYSGTYGTGYPFYALNSELLGELPIIMEQIRYGNELLENCLGMNTEWCCANCLERNSHLMPDLKRICKPCKRIDNDLKPRKVINRLPDIDMWMICNDDNIDKAMTEIVLELDKNKMYTSDIDPVGTINSVYHIASILSDKMMPSYSLPIDIHIIEYSKIYELLCQIEGEIWYSVNTGHMPYLPILPHSLRKTWQYDDEAYNFVLDYMFSMTPFNMDNLIYEKLVDTRYNIANSYSLCQLYDIFYMVSGEAVKRRFDTKELKRIYERRINSWKRR